MASGWLTSIGWCPLATALPQIPAELPAYGSLGPLFFAAACLLAAAVDKCPPVTAPLQVPAELPAYGSLGPLFFAFGLITQEELKEGFGTCGQGGWCCRLCARPAAAAAAVLLPQLALLLAPLHCHLQLAVKDLPSLKLTP